ncbi:WD repeat-containing protein 54 isoform X1 [Pogona vitticeps]
MYRKEKSILLKDSSLALYNNLSVLPLPGKQLTYFASVHGSTVNLVSASDDGLGFSHRLLQAKESSLGMGASIITQAAWCVLPSRILLVLTSRKGVQMYESDGSVMVYWHALDGLESSPGNAAFARGVAAAGRRFVCVGVSSGSVLVFDVPPKGTNITLSEVLGKHRAAITDIGPELCVQPVRQKLFLSLSWRKPGPREGCWMGSDPPTHTHTWGWRGRAGQDALVHGSFDADREEPTEKPCGLFMYHPIVLKVLSEWFAIWNSAGHTWLPTPTPHELGTQFTDLGRLEGQVNLEPVWDETQLHEQSVRCRSAVSPLSQKARGGGGGGDLSLGPFAGKQRDDVWLGCRYHPCQELIL